MKKLRNLAAIESGSPQFRIAEGPKAAPEYHLYGQREIELDLHGSFDRLLEQKTIRTFDEVGTVATGDVVFSLISGTSAIVGEQHHNYLFTQNFIKLVPHSDVDSRYLVYLLNEDPGIKRQLRQGLQGSSILKYTLKQLKDLCVKDLPEREAQVIIGQLYFNQLRLEFLKTNVVKNETKIILNKLREENEKWAN